MTHWCDKEGNVSDNDKFDVVYDAATNSGAGEDYKDKASTEIMIISLKHHNIDRSNI